jgi:hypothetical protein
MRTVNDDWRPFCWAIKEENGQCEGMGHFGAFRDHCLKCPCRPKIIPEWFIIIDGDHHKIENDEKAVAYHPQKGQVKE